MVMFILYYLYSNINGTTMTALEEMIKVFHSEEVETEVVQLGGKPIADCLQCNVCQKTGKCVIKDDGVNEFVEKAKTADGFVFATPVYFAHPVDVFMIFWTEFFTVPEVMTPSNLNRVLLLQ